MPCAESPSPSSIVVPSPHPGSCVVTVGQCSKFTSRVHMAPSAHLNEAKVQGFLPVASFLQGWLGEGSGPPEAPKSQPPAQRGSRVSIMHPHPSTFSVMVIAGFAAPRQPHGRPCPTSSQLYSKVLPKINDQGKNRPTQAGVSLSKEKEFSIHSK